jgi:hypothetical protein
MRIIVLEEVVSIQIRTTLFPYKINITEVNVERDTPVRLEDL